MEPEPQEKRRGISRVPLHTIGDPSAVKRRTPLSEEEAVMFKKVRRNQKVQNNSLDIHHVDLKNVYTEFIITSPTLDRN